MQIAAIEVQLYIMAKLIKTGCVVAITVGHSMSRDIAPANHVNQKEVVAGIKFGSLGILYGSTMA
tara:strand:- start:257 stop:451 length:195 start_codon:yes stop_codon:yes gene_type:complete